MNKLKFTPYYRGPGTILKYLKNHFVTLITR